VFLNYGISRRKNIAIASVEYIKYAEMDLLLKKGKEGIQQKKLLTMALTEAYFRDEYESMEHVKRITTYTTTMAKRLGLPEEDLARLELLCVYHDIGMVKTRPEIWFKEGMITADEHELIKLHPITGFQIVSELELDYDISGLILCHHENYDGSGYPYGLAGEEIPVLARILAIADIYDIMVHDQRYKEAVTEELALKELHNHAGTQFDPALVVLFEECLKESKE